MKISSINPSNYQVLGQVDAATQEQVAAAVVRARQAQPAWAALSVTDRIAALRSFVEVCMERKSDIATMMAMEMGKPISQSRVHVDDFAAHFQELFSYAAAALAPEVVFENKTVLHTQYREPLGVVAAIAPWNFPLCNLPWQFGQALLAGNAVVYKPSEEIILFGKLMAEIVSSSQLPDGVLATVLGDGQVGQWLVDQPVDAVLFTGSTATGQKIAEQAAQRSVRVLTELGGSAPGIVFEDADVPAIITTLFMQRFDNSGQYCDGLKRLIVHESKLEETLAALTRVVTSKKLGDAMDEATDIGPLVAKRQLDKLVDQVADAIAKGAIVLCGSELPSGLEGAYYPPTVLTNIAKEMRVWREEVFGTVLPVVTFKTESEAVELANDTVYGLGAYVFTTSKDRYQRVARQLDSGIVAHNNALFYSSYTPFGGYKASGNSRTNGVAGFHEVTQIKIISGEK